MYFKSLTISNEEKLTKIHLATNNVNMNYCITVNQQRMKSSFNSFNGYYNYHEDTKLCFHFNSRDI